MFMFDYVIQTGLSFYQNYFFQLSATVLKMLKGVCYKPGDHVGALEINGHTNNKIIQIIKFKR